MSELAAGTVNSAIHFQSVSKAFANHLAVSDINLSIMRHEFVAIVGGSGAGKTTLLKMINRLIDADSGNVVIDGRAIGEFEPHALRRQMGYVFQGIGLFPHLTVAENIGITLQLLGRDARAITTRVRELLSLVNLPLDYANRFPAQLSGGQQQRVGVARALAAQRATMLLDEPFGALDPVTRDALSSEYRRLHEALKLTTVMVTHDVFEAVLLADRIVMMHEGRIIADASPQSLFEQSSDPRVRQLIEMPHRQAARVQALMHSHPHGPE